jgi:membrane-associated phospholipid phosphatase
MTSRRKLLLCTLLVPVLPASATSTPPFTGSPGSLNYRVQPGTQESPPRYSPPSGANASARLAYWNEIALRTMATDYALPGPGLPPLPEQPGPTRTSRVMAIVQLAVFDALNAICRRYPAYAGPLPAFADSSPDAAIAQAAHDTLVALYPRQANRLHAWLNEDLARLASGRALLNGVDIGRRAAAAILALRANDGADRPDPIVGENYFVTNTPGRWRPDPVSQIRVALGAYWGQVQPFALQSGSQFRAPPPPPLTSDAYTLAFNEVKQLGGDGITTPTRRTSEQTVIGIFWSYDGSPWIGTPVRLFNQIAVQLARPRAADALELARALALVNVALADTTISTWDTKYTYDFWRPVTGIREASPGTGPTGLGDGNPDTQADPNWTPLGAPASNLFGPNYTPPFPSYTSGHASLGAAMFQTLRRLYGDSIGFTFLSDEYNGVTRDNRGRVRPRLTRSFSSLSQAQAECWQSRIYLGVHWRFDQARGVATGHQIADYVLQHGLRQPSP